VARKFPYIACGRHSSDCIGIRLDFAADLFGFLPKTPLLQPWYLPCSLHHPASVVGVTTNAIKISHCLIHTLASFNFKKVKLLH